MLNEEKIRLMTGISMFEKKNDDGIHPSKPVFQERLCRKPSDPVVHRILADRMSVSDALGSLPF